MARKCSRKEVCSLVTRWVLTFASATVLLTIPGFTVAAGPKAYVGNFKDNTISVIDLEAK